MLGYTVWLSEVVSWWLSVGQDCLTQLPGKSSSHSLQAGLAHSSSLRGPPPGSNLPWFIAWHLRHSFRGMLTVPKIFLCPPVKTKVEYCKSHDLFSCQVMFYSVSKILSSRITSCHPWPTGGLVGGGGSLTPLQKCSQYILQPQPS